MIGWIHFDHLGLGHLDTIANLDTEGSSARYAYKSTLFPIWAGESLAETISKKLIDYMKIIFLPSKITL